MGATAKEVGMNPNIIVFEGATLEETRKKLFTESPRGLFLQSQTEYAPKTKSITAVADSTEAAFTVALAQQPEGMTITNKKEIAPARRATVRAEAWDKKTAEAAILKQAGSNAVLESLTQVQPPKAGFLGLGKAPGKHEGVVS